MQKSKETDATKFLTKDFVGYGHYRINIISCGGQKLSAVTGDTELIYKLESPIDSERENAMKVAVELVMSKNK